MPVGERRIVTRFGSPAQFGSEAFDGTGHARDVGWPCIAPAMAGSKYAHAGNVRGLAKSLAGAGTSIDALTRCIAVAAGALAPVRAVIAS
jgi:hypothetical protein